MNMPQGMFDGNDHQSDRLHQALAQFHCIIDDHILLIKGEMDGFIDGPIYGALIFLRRAIAGPMAGDGEERGPSPIGDFESATHETLEQRLVGLAECLDAMCPGGEAPTPPSSPRGLSDWTVTQVGLAVVALNVAAERLRADAMASCHSQADPSAPTLAELKAESNTDATARHQANRQRTRDAGTNHTP